jgi:hypothetical protein
MTPIDSLRSEVAALRAELKMLREQAVAPQWTLTSRSSAMGAADEVQTGDDADSDSQRPVSRLEPFGLRYRAPSKLRSFSLRIGSSNVVFLGIQPSKGYGPTDLQDGEVALYCSAAGALVRLDKDGNVIVTPSAGKEIRLGGTAHKVVLDSVLGALATALGYIAASNTGGPIITNPVGFAQFITDLTNGTYQSNTVKNG